MARPARPHDGERPFDGNLPVVAAIVAAFVRAGPDSSTPRRPPIPDTEPASSPHPLRDAPAPSPITERCPDRLPTPRRPEGSRRRAIARAVERHARPPRDERPGRECGRIRSAGLAEPQTLRPASPVRQRAPHDALRRLHRRGRARSGAHPTRRTPGVPLALDTEPASPPHPLRDPLSFASESRTLPGSAPAAFVDPKGLPHGRPPRLSRGAPDHRETSDSAGGAGGFGQPGPARRHDGEPPSTETSPSSLSSPPASRPRPTRLTPASPRSRHGTGLVALRRPVISPRFVFGARAPAGSAPIGRPGSLARRESLPTDGKPSARREALHGRHRETIAA